MKTSITKGVKDAKEKEELEREFKHSHYLRKRIVALIEEKLETADNTSTSRMSYETPNWPYLQADLVGYKRSLKEMISLLSD